jgi:hypothetical protein
VFLKLGNPTIGLLMIRNSWFLMKFVGPLILRTTQFISVALCCFQPPLFGCLPHHDCSSRLWQCGNLGTLSAHSVWSLNPLTHACTANETTNQLRKKQLWLFQKSQTDAGRLLLPLGAYENEGDTGHGKHWHQWNSGKTWLRWKFQEFQKCQETRDIYVGLGKSNSLEIHEFSLQIVVQPIQADEMSWLQSPPV